MGNERCNIEILRTISKGVNEAYDDFCEGNPPYHNRGCLPGSIGVRAISSARGLKRNLLKIRSGRKSLSGVISHARIVGGYFLDHWRNPAWEEFFGEVDANRLPNLIIKYGLFFSPDFLP